MTDFVLQISDWYRLNSRDLPWRNTQNAYFIWLSEVILQQTRVDQGMKYYLSFTKEYPTVTDLANADEAAVLKLWQGLGYYSRARNLRKTAQQVATEYNGVFPANYNQLLSLKGIGPYTAAAIASFAFNLPHAVVDGNVYRVLSRYFGIDEPIDTSQGKKTFQALADTLIPANHPALFNQAIMEYGAIICTPKKPQCSACSLLESCSSGATKLFENRPVKSKKTVVKKRYFHYFHSENKTQIALNKRGSKDIWEGLFEFPMIETTDELLTSNSLGKFQIENPVFVFETKHILTHQHIHARFYKTDQPIAATLTHYIDKKDFNELPIHRLMEKYWELYGSNQL